MGEEVHHRIEDDAGGRLLVADILGELEDAVGLAAETAHRGGVVQGVAGDGKAVDAPEAQAVGLMAAAASDDGLPGEGIDAVDDKPHADDGDEPVASMADVLPEFDETHVEGEEHDHHGCQAEEEEEVVEALLGHIFIVYGLQFTVYR